MRRATRTLRRDAYPGATQRPCLKCGKLIWTLVNSRLCQQCNQSNENEYAPRNQIPGVVDGRVGARIKRI